MNMSRKFHIIVNDDAGTVLNLGRDKIRAAIETHLAGQIASLSFIHGDEIIGTVEALAQRDPQAFLVGGGDGTILSVARGVARFGLPFGILPLGTMNLMAQDLNMPVDLTAALQALHNTNETKIDSSLVNDRPFLCSAVIGIIPETALKREEARYTHSLFAWIDFLGTLTRGLSGQDTHKLRLRNKTETMDVEVSALVINNNKFVAHPDPAMRYRRATLTGGKLAVYGVCSHGAMDAARLAFKMWNGTWHEDDTVFHFETDALTVESAGKILISLDGEPQEIAAPLHFTMTPNARSVIIPANSDSE